MTQEEKQVLLKDLCARLPYGVKCRMLKSDSQVCTLDSGLLDKVEILEPYLRPISSMTEEEKIVLCTIAYAPDEMKTIEEKLHVVKTNAKYAADFYNEHHFDYRGLVPMGLAIEAPEGMYKTE